MAILWFVILSFVFTLTEAISLVSRDAMSLLSFKSSVSSDPFNVLANWNVSTNHCEWYGVECDPFSGRVVGMKLSGGSMSVKSHLSEGLGLSGSLSALIGNLTQLRNLSIGYNLFSGKIPVEIGGLHFLEILELQGNNFSGSIPDEISNISSLRILNLSNNVLTDTIPGRLIGSGIIQVIDLSNNMLSGGFKLDPSSRCAFLRHLKLSRNYLIGDIPPEIGKCVTLRTLLLDGNIFEGRIPPQIGQISELHVLDLSRNSLIDRIPKELANCRKLTVILLTNLGSFGTGQGNLVDSSRGEFNAFLGGIPSEVLLLPKLQIFWAPRANLGGRLPSSWTASCSLRILNLGQNYFNGVIPRSMGLCKNLTFLDLSSNSLMGYLPSRLSVPCMVYFNVSQNLIAGVLPQFETGSCLGLGVSFIDDEDMQIASDIIDFWALQTSSPSGSVADQNFVISHDFSWNNITGPLPSFLLGNELFVSSRKFSYKLALNNNKFSGSVSNELLPHCNALQGFSVNLSSNQVTGKLNQGLFLDCKQLTEFEAAHNLIGGSVFPGVGNLVMLERLDVRGNRLSGSLPGQLGKLRNLKWALLAGNNLSGEIPPQLGQLTSLLVLDLSKNSLNGLIPSALTNATNLETVLLDHNMFFGEIPSSFSTLRNLSTLDVSYNNLSGHIPHLQHLNDCNYFEGNAFLDSCPDSNVSPPAGLPVPLAIHKWHNHAKLKSYIIAIATSASVVLFVLPVIVLLIIIARRKSRMMKSLKKKVVVTFADAPSEVNYDNVVKSTENFSMRNRIGRGGFGSTYKAELVPGFLVAVKKLSIGRFQGVQQFDAEIRTLGRIRHKNLVTLVGYYYGEAEMFLIYNYLSGGNLESFIHNSSSENVKWPVIHKISIDIAQAVAYLHYSCVPRIVHRDIKPSNILLDEELNAYLSDFGLARLLEVSETHATTDVEGTFGYVAPEYATTCRVSDKADVYSFGVVLLELMSGKKSLDPSFSDYGNGFNIVAWAELLLNEGRHSEFFSPELWEHGPKESLLGMLKLASTCTVESLSVRPPMNHVVEKLKQLKS